ncbi:MAG: TRAP transporter substrate-binding protein [Nitrospinota bacterium]
MKSKLPIIFVSIVILLISVPSYAIDNIRWKMPIAFKSTLPALGTPSKYAADQLDKASGGKIKIKIFEPNKLVPPFEILGAVSSNKVSAGYTWIGYDAGTVPALPLFAAVPFGLKPWAFISWYYEEGGHDLLQQVYKNKGYTVHAELCGIIGPETAGWYKKPINSLKDYQGLKIRFAGLGGKVLGKLGASVSMMPGGEIFQSLEKGTIDATEFSLPKIDQLLGFDKVVKYNLFPGWHQQFTASYMLINKGKYDKLGADTKALIRNICMASTLKGLAESEAQQGEVMAGFKAKGIIAKKLPKDILRKLKVVTEEVLAEEGAKDADFKKVSDSQLKFSSSYNLWESFAYLPSDL